MFRSPRCTLSALPVWSRYLLGLRLFFFWPRCRLHPVVVAELFLGTRFLARCNHLLHPTLPIVYDGQWLRARFCASPFTFSTAAPMNGQLKPFSCPTARKWLRAHRVHRCDLLELQLKHLARQAGRLWGASHGRQLRSLVLARQSALFVSLSQELRRALRRALRRSTASPQLTRRRHPSAGGGQFSALATTTEARTHALVLYS